MFINYIAIAIVPMNTTNYCDIISKFNNTSGTVDATVTANYQTKQVEPNTEPWGALQVTGMQFDAEQPILNVCDVLIKYETIHDIKD